MPKLLSFIVPVYNTEKYLDECVRSIMNQGFRNEDFELIMVNDGSTDNSLEVAKQLKDEFSDADITIIDQENQGSGAARNRGMEIAKGKYIEFVDSDDYLEENSIKDILETAIKKNLDVIEFRLKGFDENGKIRKTQDQPLPKNIVLTTSDILVKNLIIASACTSLYKVDFLKKEKIKFLASTNHEDVFFSSCVYSCVKRIMFIDNQPYIYRWNSQSKDHSKQYEKVRKSIIDTVTVIIETKKYLMHTKKSTKIIRFFLHRGNSTIIATFLYFIKDKSISAEIKHDFIIKARREKLYPITGFTSSIKTTLLIPLINNERILNSLIY